jgi:hypothetical protein
MNGNWLYCPYLTLVFVVCQVVGGVCQKNYYIFLTTKTEKATPKGGLKWCLRRESNAHRSSYGELA